MLSAALQVMYYICSCTVLSGLAAAQLHTMLPIYIYRVINVIMCYCVFSCVIRVGIALYPAFPRAVFHTVSDKNLTRGKAVLSIVIRVCSSKTVTMEDIDRLRATTVYEQKDCPEECRRRGMLLPTLITHSNTR